MSGSKYGQKFERMKEHKNFSFFLSLGLGLFFLFPYLIFLTFFTVDAHIDGDELLWALKNTVIQSAWAAGLCVVLGTYLSLGLFQFSPRLQKFFEKLTLIPFILPSLFSILIVFSVVNPFPMGPIGVILIFTAMNLGFSIFQMSQAIKEKIGNLALVSEIFGIRKFRFLRQVLIPLIWPDMKINFTFIFLICASSLAVPLVAGGGRGTNLEVLIYEKIFIDQKWDVAWILMVLQTAIVFLLSLYYLRAKSFEVNAFVPHKYLKSKWACAGICFYLLIYVGGYIFKLGNSFEYFESLKDFQQELIRSLANSLFFLFLTLILAFSIGISWTYYFFKFGKFHLTTHLISVSTVLVGFSLYVWFPQNLFYDSIKIPVAFTVLFFPALFKMLLQKKLNQLESQIQVAKIYGISFYQVLTKIIYYPIKKPIAGAMSLLSIWSLSDFAISKSLGTQSQTLGLLTQGFLTSYRLELSYLMSFIILFLWFLLSAGIYFFSKENYGDH